MKGCWRCSTCGTNWPRDDRFRVCPNDGANCWSAISQEPDMDLPEAERQLKYREFEKYTERREQEDRKLLERTDPAAFAQYLMDAAEEDAQHQG